jgi:hypothetical protein
MKVRKKGASYRAQIAGRQRVISGDFCGRIRNWVEEDEAEGSLGTNREYSQISDRIMMMREIQLFLTKGIYMRVSS